MFPSPAFRRIRIPTLTETTPPAPANIAPTPHSLSAPRMSLCPFRVCSVGRCFRFFPARHCRTCSGPYWRPLSRARTRRNSLLSGRLPPRPTISLSFAATTGIYVGLSPRNHPQRSRRGRNSGLLISWRLSCCATHYGRRSPNGLRMVLSPPSSTFPTLSDSRT